MSRLLPLLGTLALVACPKQRTPKTLDLEIAPYPGRACQEVRVGVNELDVETERVGCELRVAWTLENSGVVETALPTPSDVSGPFGSTRPYEAITAREVRIGPPGQRRASWRVPIDQRSVTPDATAQEAARRFDVIGHRYLVFVVRDTSRSGVVYPMTYTDGGAPRSLYAADPGYCSPLLDAVRIHAADPDVPTNERILEPSEALPLPAPACSDTDEHVFAVDLPEGTPDVLDVVVEAPLRVPRMFRLTLDSVANYTVVDVTVLPQAM